MVAPSGSVRLQNQAARPSPRLCGKRCCRSVVGTLDLSGFNEASQFIFSPEEQIEYASNILTIQIGDVFSCGTCGGVGQGASTFLKPGDVMETEIESLGAMRNRFVAETADRAGQE